MANGTERGSAANRISGERSRPTLVLLANDAAPAIDEAAERLAADLTDRLDSCADLALEAQHQLELRENEARKDNDLGEIHRLDATAEMFRQCYLTLSAVRGAELRPVPALHDAADRVAAINTSLTAEIHNLQRMQPSIERLTSIVADIDRLMTVLAPLVAA